MPKRGREESAEAAGGVRKAPKHVRDEKVINKIARELDVHSGQVGESGWLNCQQTCALLD